MKEKNREELSRMAGFIEGVAYAVGGELQDVLAGIANMMDEILMDEETEDKQ